MRISYETSVSDLTEIYSARRSTSDKILLSLYFIVGLLAIFTTPWVWEHGGPDWIALPPFAAGLLLCWWIVSCRSSKQAAQVRSAAGDQRYQAEIDEWGVKTFREGAQMQVEWKAFTVSIETSNTFALFYESIFFPLPKRAFTPEQLAEFRDLLARKLPPKK